MISRIFWHILEWPIALGWHAYSVLVHFTSKVTVSGNVPAGPTIFVNWHRYQSFLIPHHGSYHRCMLVSPAPPLIPIARFCRLSGLQLIRGTSGDRGKQAREELAQYIRSGGSITLAVDGPAGPVFKVKRGCADISLATRALIVPVCYHSHRGLDLRWRWDKMLLPLPFDRITIVYGAPITGSEESEVLEKVAQELATIEAEEPGIGRG
jgi:lysophospholipid acyltransferase (LPLAT)-like uncharacterized protein